MTKSDSIKNLATALKGFQGEMTAVKKEAINPFFKSKYADLYSILEAIREPLSRHGLSISQFPTGENQLVTILMHDSGEWIEDTFSMKPVVKESLSIDKSSVRLITTPQDVGSAITYMRRYALGAVLGISTEEDDDGNTASARAKFPGKAAEATAPVKQETGGAAPSAKAAPVPAPTPKGD